MCQRKRRKEPIRKISPHHAVAMALRYFADRPDECPFVRVIEQPGGKDAAVELLRKLADQVEGEQDNRLCDG